MRASLLQIASCARRQNALAICDGPWAKVRLAAERAEDITNVVGGLDTILEGAVPLVQNALDDFHTRVVDVLNGNFESILIAHVSMSAAESSRRGRKLFPWDKAG